MLTNTNKEKDAYVITDGEKQKTSENDQIMDQNNEATSNNKNNEQTINNKHNLKYQLRRAKTFKKTIK